MMSFRFGGAPCPLAHIFYRSVQGELNLEMVNFATALWQGLGSQMHKWSHQKYLKSSNGLLRSHQQSNSLLVPSYTLALKQKPKRSKSNTWLVEPQTVTICQHHNWDHGYNQRVQASACFEDAAHGFFPTGKPFEQWSLAIV